MKKDIKTKEINIEACSPVILKSSYFQNEQNFPAGYKLEPRYVYDYELEFFLESSGSITVNDQNYKIKQGDIMFRKPGQFAQGIMPYSCYLICFDLLGNTGKTGRHIIWPKNKTSKLFIKTQSSILYRLFFKHLIPKNFKNFLQKYLRNTLTLTQLQLCS